MINWTLVLLLHLNLPSGDFKFDRVVTHTMANKMVDRIANDFLVTVELVIVLLEVGWYPISVVFRMVKDKMAKNDPKWPIECHIFLSIWLIWQKGRKLDVNLNLSKLKILFWFLFFSAKRNIRPDSRNLLFVSRECIKNGKLPRRWIDMKSLNRRLI